MIRSEMQKLLILLMSNWQLCILFSVSNNLNIIFITQLSRSVKVRKTIFKDSQNYLYAKSKKLWQNIVISAVFVPFMNHDIQV